MTCDNLTPIRVSNAASWRTSDIGQPRCVLVDNVDVPVAVSIEGKSALLTIWRTRRTSIARLTVGQLGLFKRVYVDYKNIPIAMSMCVVCDVFPVK